jgi:hypothetical protein
VPLKLVVACPSGIPNHPAPLDVDIRSCISCTRRLLCGRHGEARHRTSEQHCCVLLWSVRGSTAPARGRQEQGEGSRASCEALRCHVVRVQTFRGAHGQAYLAKHVINAEKGPPQHRMLLTGLHTVSDLRCAGCHSTVGWHYVAAHEPSEAYKVGMSVLEKAWLARSGGSVATARRCLYE